MEVRMKTKRILIETVLVASIAIAGMLSFPQAKTIFGLLPPLYLLIERRLRHRTWAELGFKLDSFWQDLGANWVWFVLAGLVIQPLTALLTKAFAPAYLLHILSRLPFPEGINWVLLVPLLAFSLIIEEMTFRALIQGRLTPFIGKTGAILLASLLFAIAHFYPGTYLVVAIDLATLFIDSILYGVIYARSNNLIVTWAAHLIGDILGMIFLLNL
jgi:membrane protease YdiL (CAAX protease family)